MVLLYGIMYIYVNLLKLLKGLHKILQKIYKLGGLWHFFFILYVVTHLSAAVQKLVE